MSSKVLLAQESNPPLCHIYLPALAGATLPLNSQILTFTFECSPLWEILSCSVWLWWASHCEQWRSQRSIGRSGFSPELEDPWRRALFHYSYLENLLIRGWRSLSLWDHKIRLCVAAEAWPWSLLLYRVWHFPNICKLFMGIAPILTHRAPS